MTIQPITVTGLRRALVSDVTFHVDHLAGSDTNDGSYPGSGGAWKTPAHAAREASKFHTGSKQLKIKVAGGPGQVYGPIELPPVIGEKLPIIEGDPVTPGNAIIRADGTGWPIAAIGSYFQAAPWIIDGFRLEATGTGWGCIDGAHAKLATRNIEFGPSVGYHITVTAGGIVTQIGKHTIKGGAFSYIRAENGGIFIDDAGSPTEFSGSPSFTIACLEAKRGGHIAFNGATFTGSFVGRRFHKDAPSSLHVNGGDPNTILPGSLLGYDEEWLVRALDNANALTLRTDADGGNPGPIMRLLRKYSTRTAWAGGPEFRWNVQWGTDPEKIAARVGTYVESAISGAETVPFKLETLCGGVTAPRVFVREGIMGNGMGDPGQNKLNFAAYHVNGQQVLGPRETGWAAMGGTASKGGFNTATVTLPQLAQVVKAIVDAQIQHGQIGT